MSVNVHGWNGGVYVNNLEHIRLKTSFNIPLIQKSNFFPEVFSCYFLKMNSELYLKNSSGDFFEVLSLNTKEKKNPP